MQQTKSKQKEFSETSKHKYNGVEYTIVKENRKKANGKIRSNKFFYTGEVILREKFIAGNPYTHIQDGGKYIFIKEKTEGKEGDKDYKHEWIFKNEKGIESAMNQDVMVVAVRIHGYKRKHPVKQRCKREIYKFYGNK